MNARCAAQLWVVAVSATAAAQTAPPIDPDSQLLMLGHDSVQQIDSIKEALKSAEVPDAGAVSRLDVLPQATRDTLRRALDDHEKLIGPLQQVDPLRLPELKAAIQQANDAAAELAPTVGPGPSSQLSEIDQKRKALLDADQALVAKWNELLSLTQSTNIIVSGGVSLGAYQAGLVYFYTQYLLAQRDQVERLAPGMAMQPQTVTGASAGAINAFLAAISGCREPVGNPEDSLFWKVWIPLDFEGLIKVDDVTATSILSTAPFESTVKTVSDAWDSGWRDKRCAVNLGFTVTRVSPRSVQLNTGSSGDGRVPVPLQTERVILVIEGDEGKPPRMKTWVPPESVADRRFYDEFTIDDPSTGGLPKAVGDILRASAAFPVAWKFVSLDNQYPDGTSKTPKRAPTTSAWFLDGGVFDNNPLGLAHKLVLWSQLAGITGLARAVLPASLSAAKSQLPPARYLYVEPDATDWANDLAESRAASRGSFISTYFGLLGNFVGTARHAELASTLSGSLDLGGAIDVPPRKSPIMGAYLFNFLAFMNEDFRKFDFYQGMADAEDALYRLRKQHPQLPAMTAAGIASDDYKCVKQFRDGGLAASKIKACTDLTDKHKGDQSKKNLLALLDATAALRHGFIDECIRGYRDEEKCTSSAELEELSQLLEEKGFRTDKDGSLIKPPPPLDVIRAQAHPLVEELGHKQKSIAEGWGIKLVGKAGLDALSYQHARWYWAVGLQTRNGIETEFSRHLGSIFRVTVGLKTTHVQSRFMYPADTAVNALSAPIEERWSFMEEGYVHPFALEIPLSSIFPSLWFLTLHAQVGVAINLTWVGSDLAAWRLPIDGAVDLTILQRLYLRVNFSRFWDGCENPRNTTCPYVLDPYKASRPMLAGISGEWSLGIGWRFIE